MHRNTRSPRLFAKVFMAVSLVCAAAASHAALSKDEYHAAKDQAKAQYDKAMEACKPLKGNAHDVCKEQAKLDRTTATATAEAQYKNTPKAAYSARVDIAEAQYDLAKEKCDDKSGNDKDVCKKEAKAAYVTAKSDAKVKLKTRKAIDAATDDQVDARYATAKARCDALSGDAKDACQAKAKAEFGK